MSINVNDCFESCNLCIFELSDELLNFHWTHFPLLCWWIFLKHKCYVAVTWWRRVSALTLKIVSRQLWLADDSWWPMEHFLCPGSSSKQTIVTIITGVTHVTIITPLWAGLGRMLMCHTLPADCWHGHNIHVIHPYFHVKTRIGVAEAMVEGINMKGDATNASNHSQAGSASGGSVWMPDKCPT